MNRGSRTTKQGQAVLRYLQDHEGFRSAQDIHAQLRAGGDQVGLTTVYRHLQSLVDEGVIDGIQGTDGQAVYRHCATSRHHHHIVCRRCGTSATVDEPADLDRWIDHVAEQSGFRDVAHTLEIFGLCAACDDDEPARPALR